jgi:ADP-heptose:LPS heptosyltransferase
MKLLKSIIISRTDNLGDVVLTLPVAGMLKTVLPDVKIYFIGKAYTRPVIISSRHIDEFIDRETIVKNPEYLQQIGADAIIHVFPDKKIARLAKEANIPIRVATSHRWFHWLFCNKLVNLSRKNSNYHEAQLNLQLLKPLGIERKPALAEIAQRYGMSAARFTLPSTVAALIQPDKFNLVLHPKSKGSAREWPLTHYLELIKQLPADQFHIFITGTETEGQLIREQLPALFNFKHVHNLTGKLNLEQLISFIDNVDGLLACSTGPLHIAAALDKYALGIYPPMRPIHPGRWAPIGEKAEVLCLDKTCNDCRKTQNCTCIQSITVEQAKNKIAAWLPSYVSNNQA